MLSINRSMQRTAAIATGGWAQLLEGEEAFVKRRGTGAGVLLINYARELLRHLQDDDRMLTESAVLGIIERHLEWADRTAMVGPGRLGVVMVPVDGPLSLSRRARSLHRDLRAVGIEVDVAYSIRRRTGGLAAAAARADAALDSSIARSRR